jgi:hypothetical protein
MAQTPAMVHRRVMATGTLDLAWDGTSPWMHVAGRPMPADPATRDDISEDQAWVAAVPLENQAALLVIVEEDHHGSARSAIARLVIPAPDPGWHDALEALPAHVQGGRIWSSATTPRERADWDWAQGGWWAEINDASELWRYARLFGSLPVCR